MSNLMKMEMNLKKIMFMAIRKSSNYQYIQESKLPTMFFQQSLPRLPIPELEKSSQRFLSAVQPIADPGQFDSATRDVNDFKNGVGIQLDKILKDTDKVNRNSSYISEPWFDMYLRDRLPLPLNYNPLLVMKDETRPEYGSQVIRASNLVISSLRFWKSLQAGILEPEIFHLNPQKTNTDGFKNIMRLMPKAFATYTAYPFKAFPLDMSQYKSLFGMARIPKDEKDVLVQDPNAKHILVLRNGNIYAVDVINENGNIETPSVILSRIQGVVSLADKEGPAKVPLGVLTSGRRDTWALQRDHLENGISSNNKDLLTKVLDSALFCLCLDSPLDFQNDETKPADLYKHLLASDAKNRWFDKSISLIVLHDGTTAVNFEHSWGDGVAVLRYFNELYKDSTNNPFVSSESKVKPESAASVRKLNFDIDDKLRQMVTEAYDTNKKVIDNLGMNLIKNANLNKNVCKSSGVSPDSMMQLAFQLAHRQVHGSYVGSYESCSTSAFRFGRTETIRPCTMATKEFCEAIAKDNKKEDDHLVNMLKNCSTIHGQLTKDATMGQGFDRHFFALKCIALKENIPIPSIYTNEVYNKLNNIIISTSTLSSDAMAAGGFGPVVKNGYGIGYSIQNNECGAVVTSYKDQRNGQDFANGLDDTFKSISQAMGCMKNTTK